MSSLKAVAKWYFNVLGISVVPLKTKKPLVKWSEWSHRQQTDVEFESLPWDKADGIALIGGSKTLGNLYLVSVDYDVKSLPKDVVDRGAELLKLLPITRVEQTPSGGQHWIYLCRKPYSYIKRYHDCCAIELLGASWLTIMYPSTGYYVLNEQLPALIDDFDFFIDELKKYDTKVVYTNQVQTSGNLQLVSGYPPCVLEAVDELARTGELDHEERLFMTTYLLHVMSEKEVFDVLKVAKDCVSGKTWYNIRWLKDRKYRPCRCDKVIEMGLCKGKCNRYPHPLGVR
jgi:hypothetical protein